MNNLIGLKSVKMIVKHIFLKPSQTLVLKAPMFLESAVFLFSWS